MEIPRSAFSPEATEAELRVIRRLPIGKDRFRPLKQDAFSYNIPLGPPKDTLVDLVLAADQFYALQLYQQVNGSWLVVRTTNARIDGKKSRYSL
jgi:hypothetical protein